MQIGRHLYPLAIASILFLSQAPVSGLDITLDSGTGTQTIADNDPFDLDIAVGTIGFDVVVGGKLSARGSVREGENSIIRTVKVGAIPPDTHATFRNIDAAAATFTIIVNSSTHAVTGPPLGWSVFYNGDADDPTPDDVEITANSVEALVQPGPVSVETVVGPVISPPVGPGLQPVLIQPLTGRGSDPSGSSTATRMVFTFTAGPGDEIRIPDSELFNGTGLEVFVYDQQDRCIDRMARRGEKVVKDAHRVAYHCIKNVGRGGGGSSAPCTSALSDDDINDEETRLIADFNEYCAPPPAWGANGGMCCFNGTNEGATCAVDSPDCDTGGACTAGACISSTAAQAVRDLAVDIIGSAPVGVGSVATCQSQVVRRAGKALETTWKSYRKCKRDNIEAITNDASLVATCLGPPQPDPHDRIAKSAQKVASTVDAKCVEQGVLPVASVFTGACALESDATFASCVAQRVACRFCLAINVTDDIAPALDCDVFDDGVSNTSCP